MNKDCGPLRGGACLLCCQRLRGASTTLQTKSVPAFSLPASVGLLHRPPENGQNHCLGPNASYITAPKRCFAELQHRLVRVVFCREQPGGPHLQSQRRPPHMLGVYEVHGCHVCAGPGCPTIPQGSGPGSDTEQGTAGGGGR